MRRKAWIALVTSLCLMLPLAVVRAQEDADADDPETVEETIKVPLKRYKVMDCGDVYRAANQNTQVAVRFQDALKARVQVPRNRRTVRVGENRYGIALALRTQCGLFLLVPTSERKVIEMLLGLPEDWPINERTLREQLVVREGQKLNIEGTVLGNMGGEKIVLVEGIHTEDKPMPGGQREVLVFWPGADEVKSMTRPGSQKFTFDCHYVRDAEATVTVTVRELTRDALLQELALRQARRQVRPGNPADALQYGEYAAEDVFDHARNEDLLLVEFTDVVQRRLRRLPERLRSVPAVRYGREVDLAVGAAFRTSERLTCVVPARLATPVAQVAGMLPGERVYVRGRVVGEVLGDKVVRVDYLGFPDTEAADPYENVWLATLEWPSKPMRTLQAWDFGRYRATDLPCLHRRGANEAVQMILRQYRERTIEVPAAEAGDEQD
jgi:hypothetical protein